MESDYSKPKMVVRYALGGALDDGIMKLSTFDPAWFGQWQQQRTFLEEWSRPGLTNFLGSVQAGGDVSSLRHPIFPPVSGAEDSSVYLTIDGTFLPATRIKSAIAWTLWAIERSCEHDGITIRTTTSMPWEKTAIVQRLSFSHAGTTTRNCRVALRLSGRS